MAKTTVDDVAAASGVSRATIYRLFPGGKDELLRETVGWEMDRFFLRLGEELGDAADFPSSSSGRCRSPRHELLEHAVLQKVLETEPDRLNALITVQQHRVIGAIAAYFLPLLERDREAGLVAADVDLAPVAEYVARLSLSLIASPGPPRPDRPGRGPPPGARRAAGRAAPVVIR